MYEYDLSIIIVAWNVKELLSECFDALRNSDDSLNKQIILVDNGSNDGTADFVKINYPEIELISNPVNLGFIRANNLAYKDASGKYILMLNSDAFVSKNAIRDTVDFIQQKDDAGVVGARLVGRDGSLQPSARYFPTPFRAFLSKLGLDGKIPFIKPLDNLKWNHLSVKECDWVVGCFLLTKKELIEKTGFFLREDFFMYNDDNDLCKRINKLGYKTYFYPVDVVHLGGANIKKMHKTVSIGTQVEKYQIESQMIYYRKNHSFSKVISDIFFLLLFDFFILLKRIISFHFHDISNIIIPHTKLIMQITLGTNFGNKSIH